jgi:chemotaxis protein MotB
MRKIRFFLIVVILAVFSVLVSGCATPRQVKKLEDEITALKGKLQASETHKQEEINRLKESRDSEIARLKERYDSQLNRLELEKRRELDRIKAAKDELTKALQEELSEYKAKLQITERGLVLTFLAEVFFDSGKEVIKKEAFPALDKVAKVLNEKVPDSPVAIEGHTDNEPIKYSGWKSNWELSCHRALAVLHYFTDNGNIKPERLSANGYGEYRPVAANDIEESRQQNRRVEIVIMPTQVAKKKAEY